jgi:hypothetical protein
VVESNNKSLITVKIQNMGVVGLLEAIIIDDDE